MLQHRRIMYEWVNQSSGSTLVTTRCDLPKNVYLCNLMAIQWPCTSFKMTLKSQQYINPFTHDRQTDLTLKANKVKVIPRQAEVAQGVAGRLRPRIFLTFRHYEGGRSSAKRTGRLYPRRSPWYSLSQAESTSGHMVQSGLPRKKKIPSDTTGNRSRDHPTSGAVP